MIRRQEKPVPGFSFGCGRKSLAPDQNGLWFNERRVYNQELNSQCRLQTQRRENVVNVEFSFKTCIIQAGLSGARLKRVASAINPVTISIIIIGNPPDNGTLRLAGSTLSWVVTDASSISSYWPQMVRS